MDWWKWLLEQKTLINKSHDPLSILLSSAGHDGSLMYSWNEPDDTTWTKNGTYLYCQIPNTWIYQEHVTNAELTGIKKMQWVREKVVTKNDTVRLWDIWWGDGHKFCTFMNVVWPEHFQGKKIISKDVSARFIDEHVSKIQGWGEEKGIWIKTWWVLEDMQDNKEIIIQKWEWRAFFVWWWTICNLVGHEQKVAFLKTMISDKVRDSADIWMTVHMEPNRNQSPETYKQDIEKLLCCYGAYLPNSPYFDKELHEKIKNWIMSWISHYIWKKNAEAIFFDVKRVDLGEQGWRIDIWAKVNKAITINTGEWPKYLNPWDFILWISSSRLSDTERAKITKDAWATEKNFVTVNNERITHLLSKTYNPENVTPAMEKLKKNIRNAIIWWVMGLATFGGWWYLSQKYQKKEKEEKFMKAIDEYWENYWSKSIAMLWWDAIDWEGLLTTWDYFVKRVFQNEYRLQEKDLETIKYDFLGWYAEQKRNGNYVSYLTQLDGVNYTDMIMIYILENKNRIKFSLNVDVQDRYGRLTEYKDIFIDNAKHDYDLTIDENKVQKMAKSSYIDLGSISFYNYLYNTYDCKIIYKNKTPVLIASVNGNQEYSARIWKEVAQNLLSIQWKYRLKQKIDEYLHKYVGTLDNQTLDTIMERLSTLSMQGIEFHSEKYREGGRPYDYKLDYLLHTFCPDILWKPQNIDYNYSMFNIKSLIENLRDDVIIQCNRFLPNKKWSEREQNLILWRIFEIMIYDPYHRDISGDSKSFIITHYRELFEGTSIQLPVLWAKKYEKDKNLIYTPVINRATWIVIGFPHWKSVQYESGAYSKSHVEKDTDHWNNKFISKKVWPVYWWIRNEWDRGSMLYASLVPWGQDASKSIYLDKLIDMFLAEKEISTTPETREEVRQEAWVYLSKPNTYLAKLMIEWWLEE